MISSSRQKERRDRIRSLTPSLIPPRFRTLAQFQDKNQKTWFREVPEIVGAGLGRDALGRPAIQIHTRARRDIPVDTLQADSFSNSMLVPDIVHDYVGKLRKQQEGVAEPADYRKIRFADPLVVDQFEAIGSTEVVVEDNGEGSPGDIQALTTNGSNLLGGDGVNVNAGGGNGTVCVGCRDFDNNYYLLGNMHVFGNISQGTLAVTSNDPLKTSSPNSFPVGDTPVTVLTADKGVQLQSGNTINYVDAALASVKNHTTVDRQIRWIGYPNGVQSAPAPLDNVQKTGAASGYTTGTIININVAHTVKLRGNHFRFEKLIMTGPMIKKGDSGSALLNEQDQFLGLFFAQINNSLIPQYALACSAVLVEEALQITLDD